MSDFRRKLPLKPTFTQRGLCGYQFPLQLGSAQLYVVDSDQGHDDFVRSSSISHIYYVLSGTGSFDIDGQQFGVTTGELVEIPPGATYTYSGKLKLLLLMAPPYADGELEVVRANPDVKR